MIPLRIILRNGTVEWRLTDGRRHRTDGPAIIYAKGCQEWWIDGKRYRESANTMPVIVSRITISYDGKTFISITEDEYEKYRYHPPGKYTKAALH
jgi:hypothetical protein